MSPDVSLPQFVVIGHRQRQIEVSLSSGNYSRLLADVQFTRSMGYYMIQVTILVKTTMPHPFNVDMLIKSTFSVKIPVNFPLNPMFRQYFKNVGGKVLLPNN